MAIDSVNQLREHILLVERALEEHVAARARSEQLDNVQRARDRRLLAELAQQVEALARSVDATAGRSLALAEEIRRERESRAPVTQAIEDLQRAQTALHGRLGVVDELARRYSAVASTLEQASDKRQTEVARLENQVKLLELRVNRDLAEFRKASETWIANTADQLKQVAVLKERLVAQDDEREELQGDLAQTREQLGRLAAELDRLVAEQKTDRSTFSQLHEENESVTRRLDSSATNLYGLGERVGTTEATLDEAQAEIREVGQRLDELTNRVARDEAERVRVEERVESLGSDLRIAERETRARDEAIARRFDDAISLIRSWASQHEQQSIEHLRRIVVQLQDQLRELEPEKPDAAEQL